MASIDHILYLYASLEQIYYNLT